MQSRTVLIKNCFLTRSPQSVDFFILFIFFLKLMMKKSLVGTDLKQWIN